MRDWGKTGTAKKKNNRKRLQSLFGRDDVEDYNEDKREDELDIELANHPESDSEEPSRVEKSGFLETITRAFEKPGQGRAEAIERSTKLNSLQRFAYEHLGSSIPPLPGYREAYEQAGVPLIYESYISTALLLSFIAAILGALTSFVLEVRLLQVPILASTLASAVMGFTVFAVSFLVWLVYPLQRRRALKVKLERQLAYSFGVLGALAAAGIRVERLFEKLAVTESNPVLAELARRFLRDVKVFGLDTESALREVAIHSPSAAFSKMLDSFAVAYRTSGSMNDLVTFESGRLFAERRDNLKKIVGDLAIMAELYITIVVVGPIIFVIILTIFTILPTTSEVPSPIGLINLIVFLGIPAVSAVFMIILDSMVARM